MHIVHWSGEGLAGKGFGCLGLVLLLIVFAIVSSILEAILTPIGVVFGFIFNGLGVVGGASICLYAVWRFFRCLPSAMKVDFSLSKYVPLFAFSAFIATSCLMNMVGGKDFEKTVTHVGWWIFGHDEVNYTLTIWYKLGNIWFYTFFIGVALIGVEYVLKFLIPRGKEIRNGGQEIARETFKWINRPPSGGAS